jgi:SAM-dependent methyltransferase
MATTTTFDWTAVAGAWDVRRGHVEDAKRELTDKLLAGLALRDGDRVLELGAGTGELAVRLADAVGPGGTVHATDAAAGMVELIRRTAAGRPQLSAAVADACGTGLQDASYDVVVFRMGLMLCEEPRLAAAECHRVLGPGGRLGVAVWAGPEHNPWVTAVGMSAMLHGAVTGPPPIAPGGVFSLGSPDVLRSVVEAGGFRDVTVEEVDVTHRFVSTDEHFDTVSSLSGPLALALAAAPPETLAKVRASAADAIATYRTDDGYLVPGRGLACWAVA